MSGFNSKSHSQNPSWKFWAIAAIACAAGFTLGWFLKPPTGATPSPLRLSGYQFISPLLACNFSNPGAFPEDQPLSNAIQATIDKHKQSEDITKASTYFLDFTTNQWSDTYENEKYYPSSLGKIPIMMAYYELAENSSAVLEKRINYPAGGADLNNTQDIKPEKAIIPGQTYSVDELIDYMIKYSDNNAAELLYENIDQSVLRNVYGDLQIPMNDNATIANLDFITPRQVATLFRILYNATYLSRDFSEKALQLMSESSFTQGLAAGAPASTTVSHKFAVVGIAPNGGVSTEHELHDCGIVYAPNHPYLLCVMTRGSSDLPTMESTIADISRTIYQKVEGN
jgi:beta-lactamase class A